MGIQGRMLRFIRELIVGRWIKVRVGGPNSLSKQTDLRIPQGVVLSVILFLVAMNGILGELGNGVDGSLFADGLAIYITTRNQKVATRALKGVNQKAGCMGSGEGVAIFPPLKKKKKEK